MDSLLQILNYLFLDVFVFVFAYVFVFAFVFVFVQQLVQVGLSAWRPISAALDP